MPRLRRLSDADPLVVLDALRAARSDGAAAVVLPPDAPDGVLPAAVRDALAGRLEPPTGTALVVPTSGTTGIPRAVALTGAALDAAVTTSLSRLGCRTGERWALALPVRHIAGLMVLLRGAALGSRPVVLADPGDPAAIGAASASAEHVALVPTQLARALDDDTDLSGFRTVLVGGGPAPAGLVARARAAGVRVVASYGMTETCGGCVLDGVPLDGTEVAVDADGRILLRGPSVATHELDGTPLRDPDGWFRTSDVGRLVDGRLEVLGRSDDVINSGGVKVDPIAVAHALRTHPAVSDAVIVGVPDREWGTAVRAVVATTATVDLAALREHVAGRLGRAHAPRELLVVDAIPRDGMGKVGADVRSQLATRPPTEVYSPA